MADNSTRRPKDIRVKLVDAFEDSGHFVILSPFLINEISTHLADWFLLNKVIKSGYSYRKFASEKKNYSLSEDEKNRINEIIENLTQNNFIDVKSMEEIKKPDLETLFILTNNQVSFYDAIHIMTAKATNCEFFVTADEELRKRTQEVFSSGKIVCSMKISKPSGFLTILKNQNT